MRAIPFQHPIKSLAMVSGVLHANTLFNSVVWDDRAALTLNADVSALGSLSTLWWHDYWGQPMNAVDSHKSWRPLATLTFRWNFLMHGYHPLGYHCTNLMLHMASCCLVLVVGRQVTGDLATAQLAALVFAVHPIHSEPVASIVGRADVLCGVLSLASIHLYLLARSSTSGKTPCSRLYLASILVSVAASLAKEVGLACYGFFVVVELIHVACSQHWSAAKYPKIIVVKSSVSMVLFSCVCIRCVIALSFGLVIFYLHTSRHGDQLIYEWTVLENSVASDLSTRPFAKFASYAFTHVQYFAKLVAPLELCYDYGYLCFPHITAVSDPRNIVFMALTSTLGACAIAALKYRSKTVLLSMSIMSVFFLPASQIIFPIGTILGERLLYLPSAGFCYGVAILYKTIEVRSPASIESDTSKKGTEGYRFHHSSVRQFPRRTQGIRDFLLNFARVAWQCSRKMMPPSSIVLVAQRATISGLLIGAATRTMYRNSSWRSERALFESSINVCPTSLKVLNNLALIALSSTEAHATKDNHLQRAKLLLDRAIEIHPRFHSALYNRGLVHHLRGHRVAAIDDFRRVLMHNPGDTRARTYLGQELWLVTRNMDQVPVRATDVGAVRSSLLRSAKMTVIGGESALPLTNWLRASLALDLEDFQGAVAFAKSALNQTCSSKERETLHERLISEAQTYNLLGLAHRALGNASAALDAFKMGLHVEPTCYELLSNAASLLVDAGDPMRAATIFSRALHCHPASAELVNNYGYFNERLRKFDNALTLYKHAQKLLLPGRHPQIDTNVHNLHIRDR
mmetsp:Transcript_22335/g.88665  ORF Transcript_22335/g.88665 Transcript_22335/m.88665 type:complete len:799 (+) Transcript_22335:112-2508(+)